jgi:hypothetical protein
MVGACGTYGGENTNAYRVLMGKLRQKGHLENLQHNVK